MKIMEDNEIGVYFKSTDEKNREAFLDFNNEFKKTFPNFKIHTEELRPEKKPAFSAGPVGSLDPNSLQVILDNPVFQLSLQYVLFKVSDKIFDGMLGKIGSDLWDKFRSIVHKNKKGVDSFKKGVVLQIPIVVSAKRTIEVFFFLDSVPDEHFDDAIKLAYQTLGKIVDLHSKENLEKFAKIGMFFNDGKWEIREHENIK